MIPQITTVKAVRRDLLYWSTPALLYWSTVNSILSTEYFLIREDISRKKRFAV